MTFKCGIETLWEDISYFQYFNMLQNKNSSLNYAFYLCVVYSVYIVKIKHQMKLKLVFRQTVGRKSSSQTFMVITKPEELLKKPHQYSNQSVIQPATHTASNPASQKGQTLIKTTGFPLHVSMEPATAFLSL